MSVGAAWCHLFLHKHHILVRPRQPARALGNANPQGHSKTVPMVELGVVRILILGQVALLGPTGDGFLVLLQKPKSGAKYQEG